MASNSTGSGGNATAMKTPLHHDSAGSLPDGVRLAAMPEWMAQALQQGVKPEQALAFIGLGLMNGLAEAPSERAWFWDAEGDAQGPVDGKALRQRLEALNLALQTGAPLTTAEVTHLLGARPGAAEVQRGGVTARRMGRNLWKLLRSSESGEANGVAFREGFRRRL